MKCVPSEQVSALAICDIYSPHSWHSNRHVFTQRFRDLTFVTALCHVMRRFMKPAEIDAPHFLQSSPLPAFLSLGEEGVSWAPRPHTAPHLPARIDLHTYGIVCQGRWLMIGWLSVTMSGSGEGKPLIKISVLVVAMVALIEGQERSNWRVISPLCCLDAGEACYHP